MLAQWTAASDLTAGPSPKAKALGETNEAREGRLREAYEDALALCNEKEFEQAKEALIAVADELGSLSADEHPASPRRRASGTQKPAKRPRVAAEPAWIPSLRYAVNRNLGDLFARMEDPEKALRAYACALDDDSSDFIIWMRAGRTACDVGQLHVARRAYETALRMRPDHILCRDSYHAVLRAIGDCDEDAVEGPVTGNGVVDKLTRKLLVNRYVNYQEERRRMADKEAGVDVVHVKEPRWMAVIDSVGKVLEKRLGKGKDETGRPVGAALQIVVDGHEIVPAKAGEVKEDVSMEDVEPGLEKKPGAEKKPDENAAEEEKKDGESKKPPQDIEVIEISESGKDDDKPVPKKETAAKSEEGDVQAAEKPPSPAAPDPRRSARQRAAEEPILSATEEPHDEFLDTMLSICHRAANVKFEDVVAEVKPRPESNGINQLGEEKAAESGSPKRVSCNTWEKVISEKQEAEEVLLFCKLLDSQNSGPMHILLNTLRLLAGKESNQFASELALVWVHLRKYAIIHSPGSVRESICVIEALLVSASKVRRMKKTKLDEASRLLTIVSANLAEAIASTSESDEGFEIEFLTLSLRCTWLFCHLNEKHSRLVEAFSHASCGLELAKKISTLGVKVMSNDSGPEFADNDTRKVVQLFEKHVIRLKRSSELEKATKELAVDQKGSRSAASKALAILAPSIRESVLQLKMDRWERRETPQASVVSADIIEELQGRLEVFGEACAKSHDSIGELVCSSIRLRISIVSYWAQLEKERTERPKKKSGQDSPESASAKLLDMAGQIRKYVALVKTISSTPSSDLKSPTLEQSGWSMREAVQMACHTLIALCELLSKMIPVLSSNANELSASQKNQCLAFTRCILAFCRCVHVLMKLSNSSAEGRLAHLDSRLPTSRVLSIIAFCLRVLADRGCCRYEGTSGALLKLFAQQLSLRLRELVKQNHAKPLEKSAKASTEPANVVIVIDDSDFEDESSGVQSKADLLSSLSYDWADIAIVRQQLAQCYYCLYRVPDLLSTKFTGKEKDDLLWLEDGCLAAAKIGLNFVSGDVTPTAPKMTTEICRSAYFLYRKMLIQEFAGLHQDVVRPKLAREVIVEIVEVLSDGPGENVPALTLHQLDAVVSAAAADETVDREQTSEAFNQMRTYWSTKVNSLDSNLSSKATAVVPFQMSIVFFEAFVLSVLSNISAFDFEYKKNRKASRRKSPKEIYERLVNASGDCVVALRCRPWSAGAWILFGRICVELADVALDEREMVMSTFGIFRDADLSSAEDGESAENIMDRANVCFEFAEKLVNGSWPREDICEKSGISALDMYCETHESVRNELWNGFGDDGDLFGTLGLNNDTTSRPHFVGESHPLSSGNDVSVVKNERLKAAIQFGKSALCTLRARESRYWYRHWNVSTLAQSDPAQMSRPFPEHVAVDVKEALSRLNEGMRLVFNTENEGIDVDEVDACVTWRRDSNVVSKLHWLYLLRRAKLKRKLGYPAADFLNDFLRSYQENKEMRTRAKMSSDIEPLYQLHAARAKLLTSPATKDDPGIIQMLIANCFQSSLQDDAAKITSQQPADSHLPLLRRAIGEDVISAMRACRIKNDQAYSEHFFKSIYYTTLMYREVLGDGDKALGEVIPLFRGEAAAKAAEANSDNSHRGYFYIIWNYRYTDTGLELAIESERKLVRWRFKMLGLYGRLLRECEDRRTLAGIISRLKRRNADDLPVDGALLDDMILAYADITRVKILGTVIAPGMNTESSTLSFRQTWQVFVESLRLFQGVRRVRINAQKGEPSGVQPARLVESRRPWCQVAIANVLHLERLRWLAITKNEPFDVPAATSLCFEGLPDTCPAGELEKYASTMGECGQKWQLETKLNRLLEKRIAVYRSMHAGSRNTSHQVADGQARDNSSIVVPLPSVVRR